MSSSISFTKIFISHVWTTYYLQVGLYQETITEYEVVTAKGEVCLTYYLAIKRLET